LRLRDFPHGCKRLDRCVKEEPVKVLAVDIGGTNVKILATGEHERRTTPSGPDFTPGAMVLDVQRLAEGWEYEVISIGYPGLVVRGKPRVDPYNLGSGWVGFDYAAAFGKPVKVLNDAAMQALGSYDGGNMLFLGLGTGLGSAAIYAGTLEPLELGHLRYKKERTYEDYLGLRGLRRLGKKKWRQEVADVVAKLAAAMEVEYVVLGGGNAKLLKDLPPGARLGNNANAFLGGYRMWEGVGKSLPLTAGGSAAGPKGEP
jgi:polyphosphate glucokinase